MAALCVLCGKAGMGVGVTTLALGEQASGLIAGPSGRQPCGNVASFAING